MKKLIVAIATIPAVLALAFAGGVGPLAEAPLPDTTFTPGGPDTFPPDDPGCPAYGCSEVGLVPLSSGGWVIRGHVRFPTIWSSARTPPAVSATVMKYGARDEACIVQEIPIRWSLLNYPHSCPEEWWGEYADVLFIEVETGDQLEVSIDTRDQCWTVVEVPSPHDLVMLPAVDRARVAITTVGERGR